MEVHSTSQIAELGMIRSDCDFYSQLLSEITKSANAAVLSFGLMPYLSLFVVETYSYLATRVPSFAGTAKREHEQILRASRARTKLLDDERSDIASLMEHLKRILDFFHAWMNSRHRGRLAWLKKWIQPDLGMYFYNDHPVCTTQAACFNLGLEAGDIIISPSGEPEDLAQLAASIGYDIGEYVGFLSGELVHPSGKPRTTLCRYQLTAHHFRHEDKRAQTYLRSIFNGKATPGLNSCLMLFMTTVHFVVYVLSHLVLNSPDTWFKIKFLTLYHVDSSLRMMQDHFYGTGQLTQRSKDYFRSLLGHSELRMLRSKSSFRNILVHYALRDVPEDRLGLDSRWFGLIECFFPGFALAELTEIVDRQLLRYAQILEDWQGRVGR